MRKEIAAEKVVNKAPHHGRDEKQDEERVPSLPGTAASRSDKQGYISNDGN